MEGTREEIDSCLHCGNVCHIEVHNILSSNFLSKNIQAKIYRSILLSCSFIWVLDLACHIEWRIWLSSLENRSSGMYLVL